MSTSTPNVIAAFDFDGTLTTTDSVVPFLRRLARPCSAVAALRQLPTAVSGLMRRDRDRLRLAATAAIMGGLTHREVATEARRYAAEVLLGGLRDDTLGRLKWHRQQGHRILFVSASYEEYLLPVAEHLGVEAVLATRLDIAADGRCTGRLRGRNCRGPEKVERLEAWMRSADIERSHCVIWAYGDSSGDTELLAYADHPHLVTRPLVRFPINNVPTT